MVPTRITGINRMTVILKGNLLTSIGTENDMACVPATPLMFRTVQFREFPVMTVMFCLLSRTAAPCT